MVDTERYPPYSIWNNALRFEVNIMVRASRSPSYPAIGLSDAIERLKRIFKKVGINPANRDTLASALGYAGRNGASDSVIAALSQYGLLEIAANQHLKISKIGLNILQYRKGDKEYLDALIEAKGKPELYTKLTPHFGDGKFSFPTIERYLLNNGFNSSAASKAAKAYRETLSFVSLVAAARRETSKSIQFPMPDEIAVDSQPVTPLDLPPLPEKNSSLSAFAVGALPGTMVSLSSSHRAFPFSFGDDAEATVIFKGQITDDRIDMLIGYLQILKKGYEKQRLVSQSDGE